MSSFIGIDLGTSYSAIAYLDKTGRPQIIPNKEGDNITPSVVEVKKAGKVDVGKYAYKTWGFDKENTHARFKRQMHEDIEITLGNKKFTPAQLSAEVLKKLIDDTKDVVGEIEEVVVSIPANFPNDARVATLEAGKLAGLNVNFIVNEPTAAALGYAFLNQERNDGIFAVYDFGGGTFDFSIIEVAGNEFNVLASEGIQKCGGDDLDQILFELIQQKYTEITQKDIKFEDFNLTHAEEVKKALSNRDNHIVKIEKEIIEINRDEFEEAIESYVIQTEVVIKKAVADADLTIDDINRVFLVGGSTRVPLIKKTVENIFEDKVSQTINPDEVVALGAALYAGIKGDKTKLSSVAKATLAKITVQEITSKCFGTVYVDTYSMNQYNKVIILKGEQIPISRSEIFEVLADYAEYVVCQITESVSPEEDLNWVNVIWKGKLELSNPSSVRSGDPIQVTYSYDENQIMNCKFTESRTGISKQVDLDMNKFSKSKNIDDITVL